MSKKLYHTIKWKRYSRQRSRRQEHRKTVISSRLSLPEYTQIQSKDRIKLTRRRVKAPQNFSLINNMEEITRFLNFIHVYAASHDVFIDLSSVSAITPEAPALLLATIRKTNRIRAGRFSGNLPQNATVRQLLVDSGIFKYLQLNENSPHDPQGYVASHYQKQVNPRLAKDLVASGTSLLFGYPRYCKPAYGALVDLMSNTHKHAAPDQEGSEYWWAMVMADKDKMTLHFTFIDTGVGIFESLRPKLIRLNLPNFFGLNDKRDVLRDLLSEGKSRTGLPYRGKGLPDLRKKLEDGRIAKLFIVSNEVYADVSRDVFCNTKTSFVGTLIYWEVSFNG